MHDGIALGAKFHQLAAQIGLVQRFPRVVELLHAVRQLLGDIRFPALGIGGAFRDHGLEILAACRGVVLGIQHGALDGQPRIRGNKGIHRGVVMLLFELLAHAFDPGRHGQALFIVFAFSLGADHGGRKAVDFLRIIVEP